MGQAETLDLHVHSRTVDDRAVEAATVRLLFEPKLAVYITERQWHATQEFRMCQDGRVEMSMETTGRKELVRWVLSWMPNIKVLGPKNLHDRI